MPLKLIDYLKHFWKYIFRSVCDVFDFQKIKGKFYIIVMQISGLDVRKFIFTLFLQKKIKRLWIKLNK